MKISTSKSLLKLNFAKQMPKRLIYNPGNSYYYNLFDCTSKKHVGEMVAYPKDCFETECYKDIKNGKTYHIATLRAFEEHKGYGSDLINFAKHKSYDNDCEGRVSLIAYNFGVSPHTFYKKMGFVSNIPILNKFLDKCIRRNITHEFLDAVEMYLPNK